MKKLTSIALAAMISISMSFSTSFVFAVPNDPENPVEFDWYTKIRDTTISKIPDQTYTGS